MYVTFYYDCKLFTSIQILHVTIDDDVLSAMIENKGIESEPNVSAEIRELQKYYTSDALQPVESIGDELQSDAVEQMNLFILRNAFSQTSTLKKSSKNYEASQKNIEKVKRKRKDDKSKNIKDEREKPSISSDKSNNKVQRGQSQQYVKAQIISRWNRYNNQTHSRSHSISSTSHEGQFMVKVVCLPIGVGEQMTNITLLNKHDETALSEMILMIWKNESQRNKIINALAVDLDFHSGQAFPSSVISKVQEHSITDSKLFRMSTIWSTKHQHIYIVYMNSSRHKWSVLNIEPRWGNSQNKTVNNKFYFIMYNTFSFFFFVFGVACYLFNANNLMRFV